MMVQPNLDGGRSRVALKDFATGLGFVFAFMAVVERGDFNTEEAATELFSGRRQIIYLQDFALAVRFGD